MTEDEPSGPEHVTGRADFASALTRLRENRGLTVRELARRLNTPSGTLGDYFSGRHVPSNAQLPLFMALLAECGVTDRTEVEHWLTALRVARSSSDRRLSRPAPPYRGLRSFEADDAELFFGRDEETGDILRRLRQLCRDPGPSNGILAVVGPSGSGKSSLLRAGLVASVRSGALDDADNRWTCTVTTPGRDPMGALRAAQESLGTTPGPRVLVIDQFEEVFTSGTDPAARAEMLRALADRDPDTIVVIGMRADFYGAAAGEPALLAALQSSQILVGPMSAARVREVILRPAERAGAAVEDGLADLILADLAPHDASGFAHDAGSLPLLSHALLSTWERAHGKRLGVADYRSAGGIEAAVQRTAEELFATLTPEQQDIARRIFVRLVNLDDDVAVTRRRMSPAELSSVNTAGDASVDEVVDRLVERRLLTAGAHSIEITHEALLSAWPRLRGWVDADRAGLRLHRQITDAANGWEQGGRDPAALLRGGRLEAATEWAADPDHRAELNQLERAYLDAGAAQAAAERASERRRTRRLHSLLAALAVLALLAGVLSIVSARARADADRARTAAARSRDDALSRQIAFQSRALEDVDPAVAQQLALVAYRISPTDAALGAVIDESAVPVITRVLGVQGPTALALSPDGRVAAVGHADNGTVHLYRVGTSGPPTPLGVVPGAPKPAQVFALAFSPDGHLLATGGEQQRVHLWDVSNPARPLAVATLGPAFGGAIQSIAISPDGRTLAAASSGPHPVMEWDVAAPGSPRLLPYPRGIPTGTTVQTVAFNPAGSALAAGGTGGTLLVWPAARAATATPASVPANGATIDAVQFTADGRRIFAGDRAGVVKIWTTGTTPMRAVQTLHGGTGSQVNTISLSPDGSRLAVGSSDNTVQQWDTSTWTSLTTTAHPGPVTGVRYSTDGRTLFTTAADGTLRLWRAADRLLPTISGAVFNVGFEGRTQRMFVATNGDGGSLRVWDVGNPARPVALGPPMKMPAGTPAVDGTGAVSGDGSLAAAGNSAGQVTLWDTRDAHRPRMTTAPFAAAGALIESLAFSPDGRLLAVGADDNTIRLWDVHDPQHPRRLATVRGANLMLNVAFSADGRMIAGANADNHAYLWNIADPARPRRVAVLGGFQSYVYGVAFSTDGKTFAATSADHTTRLWSMADPAHPAPFGGPLTGPSDYVYAGVFSHDGTRLAVASNDRTVWLYQLHGRGKPTATATLRAVNGNVFALAFSPDDRTLVAGGRSPSVAVWTTDASRYAGQLCPNAGAPLTRAEWAQYVPGVAYAPPCR